MVRNGKSYGARLVCMGVVFFITLGCTVGLPSELPLGKYDPSVKYNRNASDVERQSAYHGVFQTEKITIKGFPSGEHSVPIDAPLVTVVILVDKTLEEMTVEIWSPFSGYLKGINLIFTIESIERKEEGNTTVDVFTLLEKDMAKRRYLNGNPVGDDGNRNINIFISRTRKLGAEKYIVGKPLKFHFQLESNRNTIYLLNGPFTEGALELERQTDE